MKIYYIVTQFGKTTYYELKIPLDIYDITIYFAQSHPPTKRFTRDKPLQYFMISPKNVLGIIIFPKNHYRHMRGKFYEVEADEVSIRKLIKKIGWEQTIVGKFCKDIEEKDIISKFF